MTIEEYNKTIKKLTQFMNVPSVSGERRSELEQMLDIIDSYNGMEFLKIKSKQLKLKSEKRDLFEVPFFLNITFLGYKLKALRKD